MSPHLLLQVLNVSVSRIMRLLYLLHVKLFQFLVLHSATIFKNTYVALTAISSLPEFYSFDCPFTSASLFFSGSSTLLVVILSEPMTVLPSLGVKWQKNL